MKHDDKHEALQNQALKAALDALIEHIATPPSPMLLEEQKRNERLVQKLTEARAMLDADDKA